MISICGHAGSGKSSLAKAIAQNHHDVIRLPGDWYILPRRVGESLETFHARPFAWDWARLRDDLETPVGEWLYPPNLDFTTFTRNPGSSGMEVRMSPIVLIDAMRPYPAAHRCVAVTVNTSERGRRIIARDQQWGTRVQDRLAQLEATWSISHERAADLVLDNNGDLDETVKQFERWLVQEKGHWARR